MPVPHDCRRGDHQQRARHRGADQGHGGPTWREAATEHQAGDQQLGTVRGVHREEDVEDEQGLGFKKRAAHRGGQEATLRRMALCATLKGR